MIARVAGRANRCRRGTRGGATGRSCCSEHPAAGVGGRAGRAQPPRIVRKVERSPRREDRPLAPVTVETLRTASAERDAALISTLHGLWPATQRRVVAAARGSLGDGRRAATRPRRRPDPQCVRAASSTSSTIRHRSLPEPAIRRLATARVSAARHRRRRMPSLEAVPDREPRTAALAGRSSVRQWSQAGSNRRPPACN